MWAYVRSKRNEIFYRISQTSCDDYGDRGKNQVGFAHSRDGLFLGSSTGNEATTYSLGTGENLRLKKIISEAMFTFVRCGKEEGASVFTDSTASG